jgi:dipeptidyl-peptidase-4
MQIRARSAVAGLSLALASLAPALPAAAQVQQAANTSQPVSPGRLSVQRIFGSGDFRTASLPAVKWMKDGRRFTFVSAAAGGTTDLTAEDARTGTRTLLVEGARLVPAGGAQPIGIEGYQWSADERKLLIYSNSQQVWRENTKGLYYVLDVASGRLTPVSSAKGWQQFAKFSPDGTKVGFVRDNDLWVADLATGRETRLTNDGSETVTNGTFDWVYEEELDLRDGWRWSPDGQRIAFWRLDDAPVGIFNLVTDTSGVYNTVTRLRYPKPGTPNPLVKVGVVPVTGGATTWIDTGNDREAYLARMEWAASPTEIVVQRLNRHQNRLDVLLADARTGTTRPLFTDADSAWVEVDDDMTFVHGGRQMLWSSERDGYNHLYLYNRDGSLAKQLTKGAWDVTAVYGVDEAAGYVYFAATERGPRERQLYRVKLDGSGFQRLSAEPGTHRMELSPGSPFYLDVFSQAGVAPTTTLHATDGAAVRTLVDNARANATLAALDVKKPEWFSFRTPDGVELNGSMMKPANFDPAKKYPVLIYVYGGPGSQQVTDAWGGTRYLYHQMLAQHGYIVVSVDNRGTGGRGAAFKHAVYLNLGRTETADQIAAANYLATLPYVDGSRLGIWGWSYGGYMTSLTMMRPGSPFKAGIAVAPVTDWDLYDSIYTERYMRTPLENPRGYADNAPAVLAPSLKGDLLVIHGTGDDNVHFQNSLKLANALEMSGKQFQLMAYPSRNHSISGGGTSMHLYTLMSNWIETHL